MQLFIFYFIWVNHCNRTKQTLLIGCGVVPKQVHDQRVVGAIGRRLDENNILWRVCGNEIRVESQQLAIRCWNWRVFSIGVVGIALWIEDMDV